MTNTTNTTARTPAVEATVSPDGMMGPNGSVRFTFRDGRNLVIQIGDLTSEIQEQALLHGLKQKMVDAAAISRNPDTGRSATIDDKYNAMKEVHDRLHSGSWNKGRADGESGATGGLLFRALCTVYADKTPEAIREFLDKKTKEQQAALRAVPKIAAVIEQLKAAKVKTDGVDTEALLDELND